MVASPAQYLAEVTERAAEGEIASIYAEIRRLSGVPFVALIYRHLATIPHALEAVWHTVEPSLRSGALQERAWRIGRGAWTGAGVDLPDDVRALGAERLSRVADVIDAYNRANPVNLAIVCGITAMAASDAPARAPAGPTAWTPPPMIRSLPPIPPIDSLAPEARDCIDAFSKPGADGAPNMVPTLYRHLAPWPDVLAWVRREVQPRLAAGVFQPAIDALGVAMRRDAPAFAREPGATTGSTLSSVTPLLNRFATIIPEMIVVGSFLSRSLARPSGRP